MNRTVQSWTMGLMTCAAFAAGALAGCDGTIGEPGGNNGSPGAGSGATGAGSGATGAGSGATGTGSGSTGTGSGSQTSGSTTTGGMPDSGQALDPGTVPIHRLNLAEYDNTMRDLLGLPAASAHPSATFSFPPDDRGLTGFDNIASILTLSPLHISAYNRAVSTLVPAAMTNPTQRRLLTGCDLATGGAACARTSLEAFLPRAWRRPVSATEIADLMALVGVATAQGDSVEVGFGLAVQAALQSANFLYRPELDPPGSTAPHPLNDYELASRLSYFLWSSMPDDALFASAKAGSLHEAGTLATQVTRMMADPKAQALIDNFAGQWLLIRNIDAVTPDAMLFPQFTNALRAAMKTEAQMLFQQVAFQGLPADQLLAAEFAYLSDPLAQFYGLPPVGSTTTPKRVDLTGNQQRRGFLSQGAILTVNSHANITSPVKRGRYVLTELLCEDIPPPPPDVNTTLVPDTGGMLTLRQVLEKHVSNPRCAACHSVMDPIGFGLESYDAIGAFRTKEGTLPIDPTGTLPSGEKFSGERELAGILAKDARFPACLANKMFTYALGRAPDLSDAKSLDVPTLESLTTNFTKGGFKLDQLMASIVASPTFLNRRGMQ